MTLAMAVAVVAFGVLAFLTLTWFQAPSAGTERLAITVWAAFGPYNSADSAVDSLRWASRAVFGKAGTAKHQEWIEGHIKNFRDWEAQRRSSEVHEMMRKGLLLTAYGRAFKTACQQFRDEAMTDATATMEWLNKD